MTLSRVKLLNATSTKVQKLFNLLINSIGLSLLDKAIERTAL